MHIVALAWSFVVLLWALVEALAPGGGPLAALFTLLLYGVLPLSVVLYVMATPGRRRARRRAEQDGANSSAAQPDGSRHAAGDAVAAKREEA